MQQRMAAPTTYLTIGVVLVIWCAIIQFSSRPVRYAPAGTRSDDSASAIAGEDTNRRVSEGGGTPHDLGGLRVLELPVFHSAGRSSTQQAPVGRATMFGASSVAASAAVTNANVAGSNNLAQLQALINQEQPGAGDDHLELAVPTPQPMPELAVEESPRVETIKTVSQAEFPNADDVIIVFDEVEASVERALRQLTVDPSPAPSPHAAWLHDMGSGSGDVGSGHDRHSHPNKHHHHHSPLTVLECGAAPDALDGFYAHLAEVRAACGGGVCTDLEGSATDNTTDSCLGYTHSGWCGNYDDSDFSSNTMCCACGGGRRGECTDLDGTATDMDGNSCLGYTYPGWCGDFDDTDFSSKTMCCACGGGAVTPSPPLQSLLYQLKHPVREGTVCPDTCREPFDVLAAYFDACGVPPPAEHEAAREGCSSEEGSGAERGSGAASGLPTESGSGAPSGAGSGTVGNGAAPPSPPSPPSPLMPGATQVLITGTQVVITFKVAGDVSDFDQDAQDASKARLKARFSCYPPDCYATLQITAASVNLALEMISTSPDASALVAKAEAVGSEPMDSLSAMLGATVEEGPKVAIAEDVTAVITLAAAPPMPPPPSPPSPPLLPPSPLPTIKTTINIKFNRDRSN